MARVDLPYLWFAKGRPGRRYPFYRRDGQLIPLTSADGQRLKEDDIGLAEAYERIHATFARQGRAPSRSGTLAHVIDAYRADAEYKQLKPKTKEGYDRWLEWLKEKHGHRRLADLPREAVLKLRNEHKATPRAANLLVAVLRLLLNYAEDHPLALGLPKGWRNPACRIKPLKTGSGHIPWEEDDIDNFRERWGAQSIERVYFETFLNTGQRGIDIAPMERAHYRRGEIHVVQEKTGERVWIPVADDLRAVLEPWLSSHEAQVFFPNTKGGSYTDDYMREIMRDAMKAAGLPDTRTLHGLRYTFATRGIELGMDYQTIESIVGHRTMAMAIKYTTKRRLSRLAMDKWNTGLRQYRESQLADEDWWKHLSNADENHG
jgi:integrase